MTRTLAIAGVTGYAGDDVAAIFVETIQGEAGIELLSREFLRRARRLSERYGALLGADVADAPAMQAELLARGIIVNAPTPTTIRLAPPLIITKNELLTFLDEMGDLA